MQGEDVWIDGKRESGGEGTIVQLSWQGPWRSRGLEGGTYGDSQHVCVCCLPGNSALGRLLC